VKRGAGTIEASSEPNRAMAGMGCTAMIAGHLWSFRKMSQGQKAVLVLQFLRYFKVFCVVD
jgi:hypothetical protein